MASTTSDNRVLASHVDKIDAGLRNLADGTGTISGVGMPFCFGESVTIPTTALDDVGDIRRLYQFPAGAFLIGFRGTPTDADTGATPTLVYSIVTTNSSDVTNVTVVSLSTNGQAAADSDLIATAAIGKFVGGDYLAFKTTTAATTPAAMTYKFFVMYSVGLFTYSAGLEPIMTTAST